MRDSFVEMAGIALEIDFLLNTDERRPRARSGRPFRGAGKIAPFSPNDGNAVLTGPKIMVSGEASLMHRPSGDP